MVPNNNEPYIDFIMEKEPKRNPSQFKFNSDLWEGNCSSRELKVKRSLFYWNTKEVTAPKVSSDDTNTSSNSAARAILEEACHAARR